MIQTKDSSAVEAADLRTTCRSFDSTQQIKSDKSLEADNLFVRGRVDVLGTKVLQNEATEDHHDPRRRIIAELCDDMTYPEFFCPFLALFNPQEQ